MWKRKLEAEAPGATSFYGSGKCEMNGSGSSKKILEAEVKAIKSTASTASTSLVFEATFFFFLEIFSEIETDLKPIWTSKKRKRPYWKRKRVVFKTVKLKRKRVDFKVVEAEAKAEAASFKKLEVEVKAEAEAIKNSTLPHH